MSESNYEKIAAELNLKPGQVRVTATLLADNATIPFLARYRKEATGSLDEVALAKIRDRLDQLAELDKRRQAILKSLEERELLTDELRRQVVQAPALNVLEDIYLPFRPKRRTRASVAREKGLDPLAQTLLAQDPRSDPRAEAVRYVSVEQGVPTSEDALAGARDIIAERVSEDRTARERMRRLYLDKAVVRTKVITGKEVEAAKYRDYFDWSEPAAQAPSHRVLAMRRGEHEKVLTMRVAPDQDEALALLGSLFVEGNSPCSKEVSTAVEDGYKRLLGPSMAGEIRVKLKDAADAEAISVFAQNLRELLLAPPLGRKSVLAIDPGFRTGGKVVCLDRQGKLLHHDVIYCTHSKAKAAEAAQTIKALCESYRIEAIAVGNGTGGRETEAFLRAIGLSPEISIITVNESGASIYSASKVARDEFPDHDVTVRGSISIGRRLLDPLAELVKVEPKSIGVGQYQHDVDQRALKASLDDVVMSCVNSVGVDLNTASPQLLAYASGLGPTIASNIVTYRDENGPFKSRRDLKKVKRLGEKAFEQCAGFLRIRDGDNPLDASAVHPESYRVVEAMAADVGCTVSDLLGGEPLRRQINLERYVTDAVGMPTLTDIMAELARPGRDPRRKFEPFAFAEGVQKIGDLEPGMMLPGVVTNVTAFGAFVDVGVHQDGLVHVSQLADRFVKDPAEVVKVNQKVRVKVLEVDLERKRIALTLRTRPERQEKRSRPERRPEREASSNWFGNLVEDARNKAKSRGKKR